MANAKKVQCGNGHFFDANSYNCCPICGGTESTQVAEEKKQGGFFSWWSGNEKGEGTVKKNDNVTTGYDDAVNRTSTKGEAHVNVETNEMVDVKQDIYHAENVQSSNEVNNINKTQGWFNMANGVIDETVNESKQDTNDYVDNKQVSMGTTNLFNEVKSVSSTEDPKTVGMYMNVSSEPVVGWLVCVKGASLGESFELNAGQNSIGRSLSNTIVLQKENTVSREKHAYLTFDPTNQDFYIQKGDSSGLTYLNEKIVMGFEKMEPFCKLRFGSSEFVFVPLCGDNFKWDDYIE